MTRLEELENQLSDICEEHFEDCTKCPVKAGCDIYTSTDVREATETIKTEVLEEILGLNKQ